MKQVVFLKERGSAMKRVFLFILAALLPLSVSAKADTLSFSFETGNGFVPKSVIENSLSLSNGQTKKLSGNISFDVTETDKVQVFCDNGTSAEQVSQKFFAVTSSVDGPPGQFTGWNTTGLVLMGHADPRSIEDLCSGGGNPSSDTTKSFILTGKLLSKSVILFSN